MSTQLALNTERIHFLIFSLRSSFLRSLLFFLLETPYLQPPHSRIFTSYKRINRFNYAA